VPESLVQDDLCSVFDSEISVAVLEECEKSVVRYALENGADVNNEDPQFVYRFAPDLLPDVFRSARVPRTG
jgi:hypothetical protein